MSAEKNKELVRRYFEQPSADFFSETAELQDMSQTRPLQGREEIGAFLHLFLDEAFPGGAYELQNVYADGSGAAAEWAFQGVNTGTAMGEPPTQRAVSFAGVSVYDIEDGRFVRARIYYDTGLLAEQLGLTGPRVPRSERDRWYDWWRGVR